jgi:hypothetical protein
VCVCWTLYRDYIYIFTHIQLIYAVRQVLQHELCHELSHELSHEGRWQREASCEGSTSRTESRTESPASAPSQQQRRQVFIKPQFTLYLQVLLRLY